MADWLFPLSKTLNVATDPGFFLSGNGPGSSLKGNNQLQWPVNKLVFEYDVLTAFVFHVFLLFVVLRDSPSIISGNDPTVATPILRGRFCNPHEHHAASHVLVRFYAFAIHTGRSMVVDVNAMNRYSCNLSGNLYGRLDHNCHS